MSGILNHPPPAPPLTVLLYGRRSQAVLPDPGAFHVLRRPDARSAGKARNVFVLVPASDLPQVSRFISAVNRRNQLRALLVSEDVDASSIPQMFARARLRVLRNTVVHSDESVPRRLLTAWANRAQDQLIAKAAVSADRLFVLSCALKQYEIGFDESPALRRIPAAARGSFEVDEDGSFIHWPACDVHLDLDALRTVREPRALTLATAIKALHGERYGAAIARLRQAAGLLQTAIEGLSERQLRRLEKGAPVSVSALRCLAAAHGMSLEAYLSAVAAAAAQAPSARGADGQTSQAALYREVLTESDPTRKETAGRELSRAILDGVRPADGPRS